MQRVLSSRSRMERVVADMVFDFSVKPRLSSERGKVRIAAPEWMELDAIRLFAINKLAWIRQQQKKLLAQERETLREYLERESHYVWGRRYLLQIVEVDARPSICLRHRHPRLQVRPGMDVKKREVLLANWYRSNLKLAVPALLAKWEPIVGARTEHFHVQHMKTKWGSCNPAARNIRLNTELAKKPPECLEYIVVHELNQSGVPPALPGWQ